MSLALVAACGGSGSFKVMNPTALAGAKKIAIVGFCEENAVGIMVGLNGTTGDWGEQLLPHIAAAFNATMATIASDKLSLMPLDAAVAAGLPSSDKARNDATCIGGVNPFKSADADLVVMKQIADKLNVDAVVGVYSRTLIKSSVLGAMVSASYYGKPHVYVVGRDGKLIVKGVVTGDTERIDHLEVGSGSVHITAEQAQALGTLAGKFIGNQVAAIFVPKKD